MKIHFIFFQRPGITFYLSIFCFSLNFSDIFCIMSKFNLISLSAFSQHVPWVTKRSHKIKIDIFSSRCSILGQVQKCHIQFWIVPKNVIAIGSAETMFQSYKFKTCATYGTRTASGSQPNLWPYIFFFTNHVSTIINRFALHNLLNCVNKADT